jgi:hypothetical protein
MRGVRMVGRVRRDTDKRTKDSHEECDYENSYRFYSEHILSMGIWRSKVNPPRFRFCTVHSLHMSRLWPLAVSALVLFGSGCTPSPSPKVAEPLLPFPSQQEVPNKNGFGALPNITYPTTKAQVTWNIPLPRMPEQVTVLRFKKGTPNELQLRNILDALQIPGGFTGTLPTTHQLSLRWDDGLGYAMSYDGDTRQLAFQGKATLNTPLTLSTLPSNDLLLHISSVFMQQKGVRAQDYREPLLQPDWNTWWNTASKNGLCMDRQTVNVMRVLAGQPDIDQSYPALASQKTSSCINPEFPSRIRVVYNATVDGQDIIYPNGAQIPGAELEIDAAAQKVTRGTLTLHTNPDRSDYPAWSQKEFEQILSEGGLSGIASDIKLDSYDFAYIEQKNGEETFLIPSFVGAGNRLRQDGSLEPFKVVVPFTKQ